MHYPDSSQTLFDLTLYCYIRNQRIFSLDNTFCTDSLQFKQAFPVAYTSVESDNFRGDFLNLIYRQPTADSKLANTFKTSWQTAGRSQYELELFPLQFSNVSNLTQMEFNFYSNFLRSDHYNFWTKMFPAIQLTDSGMVFVNLNIEMNVVWWNIMETNAFMFLLTIFLV